MLLYARTRKSRRPRPTGTPCSGPTVNWVNVVEGVLRAAPLSSNEKLRHSAGKTECVQKETEQ